MDTFKEHERFEIEILERLKSWRLLDPLVFVGGTMLRLCYELNRYSIDLDFCFYKKTDRKKFFTLLRKMVAADYEVTDLQEKHFTFLLEIRAPRYPKKLKIEIRKEIYQGETQQEIAFSREHTKQVMVRVPSLANMLGLKVKAFLDRKEIRDCFDIEFLIRRGVDVSVLSPDQLKEMKAHIQSFKENDYKVKLGSILDDETRTYYNSNKFSFLLAKIDEYQAGSEDSPNADGIYR